MELLVVGASTRRVCGVRDHARALEPALRAAGAHVATVWWDRSTTPLGDWRRRAKRALERADAVLWHYSAFAYGFKGVPVLVPPVVRTLRAGRRPVIGILHEPAHHWSRRPREAAFAATQRLALAAVVRGLDAVVVASEERVAWLESRPWLPSRPLAFVPLVSNVWPPHRPGGARSPFRVGVFGFGREGLPPEDVVTAAIARLRERGVDACLDLVGAPGPAAPPAERWRAAAHRAGCGDALEFSGVLDREALSRRLASLDVAVFADDVGPTARRSTLAALLAHGRPIVAFDGPQRWDELVSVVTLTDRDPAAVATSLERLARDPALRDAQGAKARAFYARRMSAEVAAAQILDLFAEIAR